MAVFNVAKAFNRKPAAQSYGFLIDQLEIKQNQLAVDGVLSEGDYDELINDTHQIMSNSNLSHGERSNLNVKISKYKKDKAVSSFNRESDIGIINKEYEDNMVTVTNMDGNNPKAFLDGKIYMLENKINQLNNVINQVSVAEGDITKYTGELREITLQLQNTYEALDVAETHIPGEAPKSGMIAYTETNNEGQIVDIDIARIGSKSGYLETNAVVNGFQVYGKLNRKEASDNVFLLGKDKFKAADIMLPDPITGGFKQSTLVYDDPAQLGIKISEGQYKEIDFSEISTQGIIGVDGWGMGPSGNLYNRHADGNNTKYTGSAAIKKMEELEAVNERIYKLNRVNENSINGFSTETVSEVTAGMPHTSLTGGDIFGAQEGVPTQIGPQLPPTQIGPQLPPSTTGGQVRAGVGTPTVRAPQTAKGVAERTQEAAKGFAGKIGKFLGF